MADHYEELDSLLFDWDTGTLDEEGVQRVRKILRNDEGARQFYLRRQTLEVALTQELVQDAASEHAASSEETWAEQPGSAQPSSEQGRRAESSAQRLQNRHSAQVRGGVLQGGAVRTFLMAAALLAVVGLAGRVAYLEMQTAESIVISDPLPVDSLVRAKATEATSNGVAILTRLVDVTWPQGGVPLDVGDALQPGRLKIESGLAQVEFFCGATVVIQGPAELDLKSMMLARVLDGRLRAQVPPAARGFTLEVDEMKVVDLGTEFAIDVSKTGADVQVFDGEIELHHAEREKRLLTAGQAITLSSAGEISNGDATPHRFVNIEGLESEARDQTNERYLGWLEWSKEIRRDPRLLTYYAFDQLAGSRRLKCVGSSLFDAENQSELDGAIVGASRSAGRWAQKEALEFKRPGDRVRVQIPGEFGSLTLACWVKIDSLDRWFNSLFLTDNYDSGEPHWQILDTGQLYFSVMNVRIDQGGLGDQKIRSEPFWQPSMSGKWLHLAVTYDVENQRATHFLNGAVLHQEVISRQYLVPTTRIGAATIGNWSLPTKNEESFAIRNLNGRIDEFMMFSAALSADEIQEIYEHGKP